MAENRLIGELQSSLELYGFTPLSTPAVELLEVLTTKGGVEGQIYRLSRPTGPESDKDDSTGLGLHFDLTVPLARYVAQHGDQLTFPFRRYQIQKVWRGERAQRGRFREFYQCDFDIVGSGSLASVHDAEILAVANSIFTSLPIGKFELRVSNRKVLTALLESQGASPEQASNALREVDKLEKMGVERVKEGLLKVGLSQGSVESVLEATLLRDLDALESKLGDAGASTAGVDELRSVVDAAIALGVPSSNMTVDPSIARGLDYYTGTVFETFIEGHEAWGSVCSGGRYDDLASRFTSRRHPGVGISIGLTRLFDLLRSTDRISTDEKCPTKVLVTMQDRSRFFKDYLALGRHLRQGGIATEIYLEPDALRDQIGYAAAKGIPFAVIQGAEERDHDCVKLRDLRHHSEVTITGDGLITEIRRSL